MSILSILFNITFIYLPCAKCCQIDSMFGVSYWPPQCWPIHLGWLTFLCYAGAPELSHVYINVYIDIRYRSSQKVNTFLINFYQQDKQPFGWFGRRPKNPPLQRSHCLPSTFSLQSHWSVLQSKIWYKNVNVIHLSDLVVKIIGHRI